MVKHPSQSMRQAVLVLVALIASVYSGVAIAQENKEGGPAQQRMEAAIRVSKNGGTAGTTANISGLLNSLPSLPGVDPLKNTKEGGENKEADLGKNIQVNNNIILPPLKGFRQLAAAKPIKEMYQELINKDVPVLFQTMMMVENGAATGFIGSLGAVSNLMNNTIQTQQFQLQLMDLTDTTGQMKYAYAGGIQKAIKDDGAKTWPQALYMVNGDAHKGEKLGKFETLKEDTKPFTLLTLPTNQAAAQKNGGDGTKQKLSDLLFMKESGTTSNNQKVFQNKELEDLKKEYLDLVGDLEIQIETGSNSDQIGRIVKVNYTKPSPADDKGRLGLQKKVYQESETVWQNLNTMLKKLCEWKKGGNQSNANKPITEHRVPSNIPNFYEEKVLRGASSPDITMNAVLIDKIWNSFFPKTEISQLQCDQEFKENTKFPDATNFQAPNEKEAEDCKAQGDGEVKPCLRNRIMVHIATVIGRSRAFYGYLILLNFSNRFAKDEATADLNEQLFEQVLGVSGGSLGEFIEANIDKNLDMWVKFDQEFGRFAQATSSSGANLHVAQSNAMPNHRAGGDDDGKK